MNKLVQRLFLGAAAALLSLNALADPKTYQESGGSGQAPVTVSFVAAADGPVTAFYLNWKGSLTALVGLRINDLTDGPAGLNNQLSGYGDSLVLGNVHAGDKLVFFLDVPQNSARYYSDASLNNDGLNGAHANHIWTSPYTGDNIVPAGLLIAFEDLPGAGADFNYHDHGIVVQNVLAVPVPEPANWALLLAGAAGLAVLRRRR